MGQVVQQAQRRRGVLVLALEMRVEDPGDDPRCFAYAPG
jgi:hypothetical protein